MKSKQTSAPITRRKALKIGAGAVAGIAAFGKFTPLLADSKMNTSEIMEEQKPYKNNYIFQHGEEATKIDFSYAFAPPHRITVGRPDASERTLLDLQEGSLKMSWTYDNLSMNNYPPLAFRTPPTLWKINITPQIDNDPLTLSRWSRLEGVLPGLENIYENTSGQIKLDVLSGMTAALIRIEINNTDSYPHQYSVLCESPNFGENPGWIEPQWNAGDTLLAGWNDRADRILLLGLGADSYSLNKDGAPPGAKKMILIWNMKPGEKREGWIIRPYHGYASDLPALRKHEWAGEMEQGKKEWNDLLGRASRLSIPDPGVTRAYLACLSDLFIMREPLSDGRIIGVPGTEGYRAGNSGEPLIVSVILNQNGLHQEAAAESLTPFETQEADGCWADRQGWCHTFWAATGFKSWALMEHYYITRDIEFLEKFYPYMLASSRWNEKQRARMRTGDREHSLTYGLMPRGFGDCGLMNDDDMYGVFFPHNIWAVFADRCSLEAARILGKSNDINELGNIYETAYNDLLIALDRGVIKEEDYRWIPGTPGKTTGSCWGVLNIASPCGLLPVDHELVTGTLRKIEANISKGGQPIHTGWMPDGAWVAITLDNIAEVHLARGNGDKVVNYLYSTLNHGTPLYTWCEERGQEPGTTKCSGDRQHLWTPAAVVRIIRDMMVTENNDGLNLGSGIDRDWLLSGKPVGIADAYTHFGKISYQMEYDKKHLRVSGEVSFAENSTAAWAVLHTRLPDGLKLKSVNKDSGAQLIADGSGIRWNNPRGTFNFSISLKKDIDIN